LDVRPSNIETTDKLAGIGVVFNTVLVFLLHNPPLVFTPPPLEASIIGEWSIITVYECVWCGYFVFGKPRF
jgi:hypothetical protein